MSSDDTLLAAFRDVVGEKGLILSTEDKRPYLTERREKFEGDALCIVRPATTQEVAAIVKLCADADVGIVPQGGNTGLVGGQIPSGDKPQIVLSTERINRIRSIDPGSDTMVVDAGAILSDVQERAETFDRLFPLSLASEGSARIGGLLSTNAGGTNVLRFGNARDLVLGLEVVTPDGEIWNGLSPLRKDNTGYDLKHLFMGAEGTLGIITGACLKLFPRPRSFGTAFIGISSVEDAIELLGQLRSCLGDTLTAFELMPRFGLELVLKHIPDSSDPFGEVHPWYVLAEMSSHDDESSTTEKFQSALMAAGAHDSVVAQSQTQAEALWRLRSSMSDAQKPEGGSIKHDISVPISAIPEFLKRAIAKVEEMCPGVRPCPFGHLGDGNLHFNLTQPEAMERDQFLNKWEEINEAVHDIVHEMGGSISAEHGIGILKRDALQKYKDPVELNMMRKIKTVLDPKAIMNPGKVL